MDFEKRKAEMFKKWETDILEADPEYRAKEKQRQADIQKRVDEHDMEKQQVYGELYKIHKRSLPVGLDKPVMWNLPKEEALQLLNSKFKAKLIDEEKRIVHYYEKVRQDGHKSGIYDNEYTRENLMKEDGNEEEIQIVLEDVKWEG